MNAQAATTPEQMTVDEFLSWDGGGHVGKLELVEGVVRALDMTDAEHAIVEANLATAINIRMRARVSVSRAAIRAPIVPPLGKRINARAPDVAVTCTEPSPNGTFVDPVLIVEVMSPTNENDTWESIHALAGLQSLKEVLVAYSTRIEVQLFQRDTRGAWFREPETCTSLSDTIALASIGLDLPLSEIYFGTHLGE